MPEMVQIDELIDRLQTIQKSFGNTCVYIRGSLLWGGLALNERDKDVGKMTCTECGVKHKAGENTLCSRRI